MGRRLSDPPRLPQRSRLGTLEAFALVAVCAAFAALIAFTFSRPPRAPAQADPPKVAATPPKATFPDLKAYAEEPSGEGRQPAGKGATAGGDDVFDCPQPMVTDGDTLRCGKVRVRLASIDAPEMPGHCRQGRSCTPGDPWASTEHLRTLIDSRPLACRQTDVDHYGRVVALCSNGHEDLSCSQVRSGHAVVRYGDLTCP